MCIRDRFGIILGTGVGGGLVVRGTLINAVGGFAGEWGHGPVSYTHLRAHETVLDLVCRLLLEKKKETQPCHKSQADNTGMTYRTY